MARALDAEWFWTDRWTRSRGFGLPMEARGLYREMLTQAWRRGAQLPNDPETIRRYTGCNLKEWNRSWPLIEKFWIVEGEYMVNPTQVVIYAEAQAMQRRASDRGRAAAEAMRKRRSSDAPTPAQAELEHQPPVSSRQSPEQTPLPPKGERLARRNGHEPRGSVCPHEPMCARTTDCIEKTLADARATRAS